MQVMEKRYVDYQYFDIGFISVFDGMDSDCG